MTIKYRQFSKHIAKDIRDELSKLNKDELLKLISDLNSLTKTNCDWLEYHLKDILIECASNELKLLANKEATP
jgi:hypothetical protein